MDADVFNIQIRKFLKQVGVTSQREIEAAVRAAVEDGRLKGDETLTARMTLTIETLGLSQDIEGNITLSSAAPHDAPPIPILSNIGIAGCYRWRAIALLISPIAFPALSPLGQALVQFMIVWHRYSRNVSSSSSRRWPVASSRESTIQR